ncbi:unnamed protein product [Gordionus sp. m RMFG-2023]|uniref:charged multivesicular body protein 4b-like n=1 Tax=Gordionus sp. m RMFG-2023 TaxID=3053472 RepID=UPI0030E5536E
MSIFNKLMGSGKKEEVPTPQEAITRLRDVEDMLIKKSDYLENKIQQEIGLARKNASVNKRIAIQALKRKKRYEKQLQQIDGTLSTIEFQRESLENANTNTEVLRIMGYAAKALKITHKDMDIDKVHDLMDDVAEQQDIANEISDAISNPIGFGQDIDEAELNAELEQLEQEELDKQLLNVAGPSIIPLPTPPMAEPSKSPSKSKIKASSSHNQDDEDLRLLESWAH